MLTYPSSDTKQFATQPQEISEISLSFDNDIQHLPSRRLPLSGIHNTYYRSKLFNIDTHINPLVSAAAPLLAIASALNNSLPPTDLSQLYQDLCHEIKAFENKAQTHNYRAPMILAARYILCVFIDEMILSTAWGTKTFWQQQNLLNTFQGEIWGGERFFIILERSCEDPAIYIDLLELIYICLSLGFAGKYQRLEHSQQQLAETMDSLYEIIQQQRGECSQKLFLSHALPTIATTKKSEHGLIPYILIFILTCFLLSGIYVGLNYLLNIHSSLLYQELNILKKTYSSSFSNNRIVSIEN